MTVKFCVTCGSPIKEEAKFCTKCGWKIPETGAEKSDEIDNMEEKTTSVVETRSSAKADKPSMASTPQKPPETQRQRDEPAQRRNVKEETSVDYEVRPQQTAKSPKYENTRDLSVVEEQRIKNGPSSGNIITIAISSMVIVVMVILLIMEIV